MAILNERGLRSKNRAYEAFERLGLEKIGPWSGSRKAGLFECKECGYRWEAEVRQTCRGKGCPECLKRKNRVKNRNEVIGVDGRVFSIDVSCAASPDGVMLINRKKWELLQAGGIGRISVSEKGYAIALWKGKKEFVHRIIMGLPDGIVDHRNRVKLDNRRCNLRIVDECQSNWNQGMRKTNKSGVIGVHWMKGYWWAELEFRGEKVLKKKFKDKDDAIAARAAAEVEYFGKHSPNAECP